MSRPIRFDSSPRVDHVTLAVLPIDGFTGALVPNGVKASIKDMVVRPVVNASGMLVFLNLLDPPDMPNPPSLEVEIDGRDAGFFGPMTRSFTPPAPNDPAAEKKRRLELVLTPRPDYPYPGGTTLIRGVVVRGADPVAGATVSTTPDQSGAPFEALTDERGAFALALRRHPVSPGPFEVDIQFAEGADSRDLQNKTLTIGRSHSFKEPIDIGGNNDPGFFTI
jgi:hypothetical protein